MCSWQLISRWVLCVFLSFNQWERAHLPTFEPLPRPVPSLNLSMQALSLENGEDDAGCGLWIFLKKILSVSKYSPQLGWEIFGRFPAISGIFSTILSIFGGLLRPVTGHYGFWGHLVNWYCSILGSCCRLSTIFGIFWTFLTNLGFARKFNSFLVNVIPHFQYGTLQRFDTLVIITMPPSYKTPPYRTPPPGRPKAPHITPGFE